MLLQLSHFPLFPSTLHTPSHPNSPRVSSRLWVIRISSLASTFPVLFLTSLCLFSTYHLCYLFPVPCPPFPTDDPPCDLYFCDSISVPVVCLVFVLGGLFCWVFFFGSVDSCEFIVILLFIVLIFFFFLDKSL